MPSTHRPTDLFHNTHSFASNHGRLTSSPPSVGQQAPSTPPSVGNNPPSTPPQPRSSALSTPNSTGYAPPSGSEYSPPMSSDLLPDAPQTLDLMLLTEYLNSAFKQAGNDGVFPSKAQQRSMQDVLYKGRCARADMEAGFLHAVSIVRKARKALAAAEDEVGVAPAAGRECDGMVVGSAVVEWEEVDVGVARTLWINQLQHCVVQAYVAVARIKVAIVDVYRRQMGAKVETGDESTTKSEAASVGDRDEDRVEVDSVFEA